MCRYALLYSAEPIARNCLLGDGLRPDGSGETRKKCPHRVACEGYGTKIDYGGIIAVLCLRNIDYCML